MREIKFRVWDKVIKTMVTKENVDNLLEEDFGSYEEAKPYDKDEWYPAYDILAIFDYFDYIQDYKIDGRDNNENRFEIMQYTGLKDKNGNEIYERRYSKNIRRRILSRVL